MLYDLCAHCDHFVEEGAGCIIHNCDEVHHFPDDDHAAFPRGTPKTLEQWRIDRPDLFVKHPDGLIGPNSQYHKHPNGEFAEIVDNDCVAETYDNEECPDCGEPIPHNACWGGECDNCGHVWNQPKANEP